MNEKLCYILDDFERGYVLEISGKNATPTRFYIKKDEIFYNNIQINGATYEKHHLTKAEIIDHIKKLYNEGYKVETT